MLILCRYPIDRRHSILSRWASLPAETNVFIVLIEVCTRVHRTYQSYSKVRTNGTSCEMAFNLASHRCRVFSSYGPRTRPVVLHMYRGHQTLRPKVPVHLLRKAWRYT